MPSTVPSGRYCNWMAELRLLYSSAHFRKRGTGTLDPVPTRTTESIAMSSCDPRTPVSARTAPINEYVNPRRDTKGLMLDCTERSPLIKLTRKTTLGAKYYFVTLILKGFLSRRKSTNVTR